MSFVWLNKQGVASDEGFALQRIDRFAYEYREESRTMQLDGESIMSGLDNSSFGFGFYAGWRYAEWQPPFSALQISEADRCRIVKNIKEAFAFMGGRAEFE